METNELEWWGYKHTSGGYHTKRYFDRQDIIEARESPFCEIVVGPFMAKSGEHALEQVESLVKDVQLKRGENPISDKMNEFLDKVDTLCWEYGYEIHPTVEGWTGKVNENGEYNTIAIIGNGETARVTFIDGDGRGK